jgi:hypothetical protein
MSLALVAYAHPLIMAVGLGLALSALRLGLVLRDHRVRRRVPPTGSRGRHLRVSQPAVWVVIAGFVAGPLTSWLVRGWIPFTRLHAWAGLAALVLFASTSLIGLALKRRRSQRAALHGILGMLAILASALAVITGIELLP